MARNARINRQRQKPSLEDEIAHLRDLDLKGLRVRWQGVFKRQAPSHLPRHLLFGVLAYRLQADALGDLDVATVRLLKQIAAGGTKIDAVRLDGRVRPPTIGTEARNDLMREWNGHPERVRVIDEGFAWKGKTYDSLSSVAFAITGTKWNGPRFFGLRDKQPDQAAIGVNRDVGLKGRRALRDLHPSIDGFRGSIKTSTRLMPNMMRRRPMSAAKLMRTGR